MTDAVSKLVEALEAFPEDPNPYAYRIAHAKAQAALQPAQPAAAVSDESAYNFIDRFLRNNLHDDDYAEYSQALDILSLRPQAVPMMDEPVEWQARCVWPNGKRGDWRHIEPTKTEPTQKQRADYLESLRRADGSPSYEVRALVVAHHGITQRADAAHQPAKEPQR